MKKPLEDLEDFETAYVPFLINKALSFFNDTLFYANEMNMNGHLPKQQQYDFLFTAILPRKRFTKWPKKLVEDDNLAMVAKFYGYNNRKAAVALTLLNDAQIKTIKEAFIQGGIKKDEHGTNLNIC